MIEYTDKQLGKIKVLNVTEARANFATVLGDGSYNYVITKNNEPLRVIVSYDEFEALKKLSREMQRRQKATEAPVEKEKAPETPKEASEETTDKDQELAKPKRASKSKSRVMGMLEANIAYTQKTPEKRVKEPPKDDESTQTHAEPQETTFEGGETKESTQTELKTTKKAPEKPVLKEKESKKPQATPEIEDLMNDLESELSSEDNYFLTEEPLETEEENELLASPPSEHEEIDDDEELTDRTRIDTTEEMQGDDLEENEEEKIRQALADDVKNHQTITKEVK